MLQNRRVSTGQSGVNSKGFVANGKSRRKVKTATCWKKGQPRSHDTTEPRDNKPRPWAKSVTAKLKPSTGVGVPKPCTAPWPSMSSSGAFHCVSDNHGGASDIEYVETKGQIIAERLEDERQNQDQQIVLSIEGRARCRHSWNLPKPCDRAGAPMSGGYPLSEYPVDVCVDVERVAWLPDDWAQVIREFSFGPQVGWLSPSGVYYPSQAAIEAALGRRSSGTLSGSCFSQSAFARRGGGDIGSEQKQSTSPSSQIRQIDLQRWFEFLAPTS